MCAEATISTAPAAAHDPPALGADPVIAKAAQVDLEHH